ncbi:MAG TPA: hypothetical protein PKY82_05705 [Pyrinomonadaceae bacterium]|nr:hypothetical protein [Pyrinomonadaceae bacterium]
MSEIEEKTQDRFVRRIARHLLEDYSNATVFLPDEEKLTVSTLPQKTLRDLVRTGIARARHQRFTFESSIAVFTTLMFEVAPNFYTNSMCQVILNDENAEPNERIDLLVSVLSEKTIETMKGKYDPKAWKLDESEKIVQQAPEIKETPVEVDKPQNTDFTATVKIN